MCHAEHGEASLFINMRFFTTFRMTPIGSITPTTVVFREDRTTYTSTADIAIPGSLYMQSGLLALFWRYHQVPEVRVRTLFGPESNGSFSIRAAFHILDDQARLRCAMHVQLCRLTGYNNPDLCPLAGSQVDVRLIHTRALRAQLVPPPVGMLGILAGVIAPKLVISPAVRRPQVKTIVFVMVTFLIHTEGNAHKTAGKSARMSRQLLPGLRARTVRGSAVYRPHVPQHGCPRRPRCA